MSNESGCECLLEEQAENLGTTNCPGRYEHADLRVCRTQQNACPRPMHRPTSGHGLCSWRNSGA